MKDIENEYKKHASGWHYKYNWPHKGWSELPEGEKEWRLSINHSNPQQGNVQEWSSILLLIRRLSSGYEPIEGEALGCTNRTRAGKCTITPGRDRRRGRTRKSVDHNRVENGACGFETSSAVSR